MECKITNSAKTIFLRNDYLLINSDCMQTYITDVADPIVGHWLHVSVVGEWLVASLLLPSYFILCTVFI
jgi:hypothetical protein